MSDSGSTSSRAAYNERSNGGYKPRSSASPPPGSYRRSSNAEMNPSDDYRRGDRDSHSHAHRPSLISSMSARSINSNHGHNGGESSTDQNNDSKHGDDKKAPKRPREQYSCIECFRRKQKCDRRFPCNNCIKRRLPERCLPPASARAGGIPAGSAGSSLDPIKAELTASPSPAKRAKREDDGWNDRKVDELARTTSRLSRLERILALHDPSYVEQRLAMAERAIQTRIGEDGTIRGSTDFRSRAGIPRDSSYAQEETEHDRPGDGHLDDNDGFLGTSALEAVHLAPQLQGVRDTSGKSPAGGSPQSLLFFIQPTATRRGFPIPSADVQSIQATLHSREQCDRYFDAYFSNYNWSRAPIPGSAVRERYKEFFSGVSSSSAIRVDAETLPFVALVLAILTLGSVPPAVQPLTSATSHTFFWATKKALVLCEMLGLSSLDTCWAHGVLVRYLDVIRVTRASWHEIGSWIRDALDLGLHRDGSLFKLPKEQIAARRILWSHVLHNDREWSILLGRPLTITFHTTEMPTREDLEHLGFACQSYLLARNRFTACLEGITQCFQERSQPLGPSAGRASRSYYKVLEVDDMIAEFIDSLPPFLASGAASSGKSKIDTSLDEHHPLLPYYRHIMNSEVCFYRSLLHRPYLLRPALNGKHPFPESRRICVETALNDLRARKEYAAKLSKEEIAQAFGGAYAMFNSAIVVGLSLLTSFSLGEKIPTSDLVERLGFLQDYIIQQRRNLEAGNVDASAEKERLVMEALLARLDPILPQEIVKSSRGELAAAAAQTSMCAAATRGHSKAADDEQQALDSLRMLSAASPVSTPKMMGMGHSANGRSTHHPSSLMQSPMVSGLNMNHVEAGPGSTFASMTIGLGNVNPIDPYGWLLTPSSGMQQDDSSSTGTDTTTPAESFHRAGGGAPNGFAATHHAGSAGKPVNAGDQQPQFDWEGILQTIGSGWVGDSTLEPNLENLFG